MFSIIGGWILSVSLLLIGGAIEYFSFRQMFWPSPTSSPTESALLDAAQALLAKADAGDAEALFQCGAHYENGSDGFACDREIAKDYYRRAAEIGHVNAVKRVKLFKKID